LDHGQFQLELQRRKKSSNRKNYQIAAKNVVKFKAGAELEGAVN
jgi:nucleoid DNA-binding protein